MRGKVEKGFEMWGWAQLTMLTPSPQTRSLLDVIEEHFTAFEQGEVAGFQGHLRGENPRAAPALHRAWDLGWERGNAALMRAEPLVVVLR